MACGFGHGYFGIQERSRGRKVVLISVWDPTMGDDAKKVPLEQRVEILDQDPDVEVKRVGGEGTGGQSFLPYDWKSGETCGFLIRCKVEGEMSAYSGHFYFPTTKSWKHLVTFRTRTGGDRLAGLYSFVEDFRRDIKSATETRRAAFRVMAGSTTTSGSRCSPPASPHRALPPKPKKRSTPAKPIATSTSRPAATRNEAPH